MVLGIIGACGVEAGGWRVDAMLVEGVDADGVVDRYRRGGEGWRKRDPSPRGRWGI